MLPIRNILGTFRNIRIYSIPSLYTRTFSQLYAKPTWTEKYILKNENEYQRRYYKHFGHEREKSNSFSKFYIGVLCVYMFVLLGWTE